MTPQFTTFQTCQILHIKYWRLRDWLDRNYISPSIQKASGQGSKSLFSFEDTVKIGAFKELIEVGVRRQIAEKMIREIPEKAETIFISRNNCEVRIEIQNLRKQLRLRANL